MSTPSVPSEQSDAAPSPFHRLADFLALPRLGGLALSADGTRLAVSVGQTGEAVAAFRSARAITSATGIKARTLSRLGILAPANTDDSLGNLWAAVDDHAV